MRTVWVYASNGRNDSQQKNDKFSVLADCMLSNQLHHDEPALSIPLIIVDLQMCTSQ